MMDLTHYEHHTDDVAKALSQTKTATGDNNDTTVSNVSTATHFN